MPSGLCGLSDSGTLGALQTGLTCGRCVRKLGFVLSWEHLLVVVFNSLPLLGIRRPVESWLASSPENTCKTAPGLVLGLSPQHTQVLRWMGSVFSQPVCVLT